MLMLHIRKIEICPKFAAKVLKTPKHRLAEVLVADCVEAPIDIQVMALLDDPLSGTWRPELLGNDQ